MRGWLFVGLAALLAGCGLIPVDRPTVQQGNILTAENIVGLEEGLTKARVQQLLGTPVLRDRLHPGRWDYIYYRTEGGSTVEDPQRLTLFFKDGRLMRIVDRYQPPQEDAMEAKDTEDAAVRPLPQAEPASAPSEGAPQPGQPDPGPVGP